VKHALSTVCRFWVPQHVVRAAMTGVFETALPTTQALGKDPLGSEEIDAQLDELMMMNG